MIFCKVENGVVINRIVAVDGTATWGEHGETWIADEAAQIGWTYVNGAFVAPPTPDPVAPTAANVKAEARRRIFAVYPDWKQTNMVARGVYLQDIWRRNGAWATQEQAEADALTAAWTWIKLIRGKSDAIEAMTPIPTDYTSDQYWT